MKTLDEVIELSERCTLPYPGDCLNCEYFEDDSGNDCRCKILADALHYLQDYRMLGNDFAEKRQELEDEKARYQEAVRNCEEAELKYRKLAQSLGEVGNTEIPLIESNMTEEEAEAIRKEIMKGAKLRRKLGAPPVEGM